MSNALPGVYSGSQVVALNPEDPAALALAEMLGGLPVTANEGLEPTSLVVVVADDYAGPSSSSTSIDTSGAESPAAGGASGASEMVGTPGEDFGAAEVAPQIDAGGDGPRCVN